MISITLHPENIADMIFIQAELMGERRRRRFKDNAVPTVFSFTVDKKKQVSSEQRSEAAAKKRLELILLLRGSQRIKTGCDKQTS